MADEPTTPTLQHGDDGEEASKYPQLMAMMLQLQASIERASFGNTRRSFHNRVYDLSEQTSSLRDATETCDANEEDEACDECVAGGEDEAGDEYVAGDEGDECVASEDDEACDECMASEDHEACDECVAGEDDEAGDECIAGEEDEAGDECEPGILNYLPYQCWTAIRDRTIHARI